MLGFHPVSSAPVSALTTRPLTASDSPVYAQAKPALSGGKRSGVSNSWVDLGGVVVSSDSSVYAQSSPKPSRLKPLANVWNDRDFASDVPSTIAQAQIKRVANKNSGTSWVDLSDTIVISDAPIYGQANVRTARSKSLSGAWNDVDFASDGLPIVAQSKPQRGFAKSSGAVWFDRDIPDAPIYAQSLAKRIARATTGGAAWTDLSTVVIADDLAVYGQSNARIAKQRINPSVWVDFDTSVAVSSDLSPYSQSIPRRKQLSTNSYGWVDFDASIAAPSDLSPYAQSISRRKPISATSYSWGDLDTSIAVSSDLSPYAQSTSQRKQIQTTSFVWINPDRDDAPIYAQNNAKPRAAAAYSSNWVNLEPTVSSDLSPYAQTDVSRVKRDATRRNTGTVWNSGDDFFPPQDDLSAYGQSNYLQSRLVYRPRYQGSAWVDLIDAIAPPIVPPVFLPGDGIGFSRKDIDRLRKQTKRLNEQRLKQWHKKHEYKHAIEKIYHSLYETPFRDEAEEIVRPVLVRTDSMIARPAWTIDLSALHLNLDAIQRLLDLYLLNLDDEEAATILLLFA